MSPTRHFVLTWANDCMGMLCFEEQEIGPFVSLSLLCSVLLVTVYQLHCFLLNCRIKWSTRKKLLFRGGNSSFSNNPHRIHIYYEQHEWINLLTLFFHGHLFLHKRACIYIHYFGRNSSNIGPFRVTESIIDQSWASKWRCKSPCASG